MEHLGRALEGEEHDSRVQLLDRVDGELERRDDAEVAVPAAERPEELCLVLSVDPDRATVRGDELDRGDAVRLKAVLAPEPAHAATERVAGHADVGRRAVQRGEPVLGELRSDAAPLHACSGPHAPGPGVDGGLLELADVDEECVLERAVRVGVVAGGLRRNAQPVVAGVFHGRDDVAHVLGERDCGGPQVRCQVEHLPRRVPVGVRRGHDASAHLRGQGLELTGSEHLDHPFIEQSVYRSAMLT